MQKISGLIRKAVDQYQMIQPGDRIAVGISGGKDSMGLLGGLAKLKTYYPIPFDLVAVTLDPGFGGQWTDYSPIEEYCKEIGVDYVVKRTQIGEIVFDIRKEDNPCSLCARMRRGCLHDVAKEYRCNKIALGHHQDDAVETFIMNLFNGGNIACFSPVTYLSRKDLTMIRPLIFALEREIESAVRRNGLPVVKSVCPADGVTQREWTKQWLKDMEEEHPGIKKRIFGAICRGHISDW